MSRVLSPTEAVQRIVQHSGLASLEVAATLNVSARTLDGWVRGAPVGSEHYAAIKRVYTAVFATQVSSSAQRRQILKSQANGPSIYSSLVRQARGRAAEEPRSARTPLAAAHQRHATRA